MRAIYDDIGASYSTTRCTDPGIAKQIHAELKGASRIVNIGAGTSSYEPEDIELVAVEPSLEMIRQRPSGSHPVEQAFAEQLPFDANSFSHALTVLSMHHWEDRPGAFDEINRVATDRFVGVTWNPGAQPFWLTRDYFPEILEMDKQIFPAIDEFDLHFDDVRIRPLLIPADCHDGLLPAFWKRPAAYLRPEVRRSTSAFAKLEDVSDGLQRLQEDLASGAWAQQNAELLQVESLDVGFVIVTAKIRNLQ